MIVCKILFCSEFTNIPEKSWRRRRWRKLANAKRFAFQANAISFDIFCEILHSEINKNIRIVSKLSKFPFCMKMADVTPMYKKRSQSVKDNYHPGSVLSKLPKVFERCLYKQLSSYFDTILSKSQCGFRKNHTFHY